MGNNVVLGRTKGGISVVLLIHRSNLHMVFVLPREGCYAQLSLGCAVFMLVTLCDLERYNARRQFLLSLYACNTKASLGVET